MTHKNEHKSQQSLYLRESTVAALRSIAEQTGVSVSHVADEFLERQIKGYRSENIVLRDIDILEQSLPPSLAGVEDDHPIFGSKKPKKVITKMHHPIRYLPS